LKTKNKNFYLETRLKGRKQNTENCRRVYGSIKIIETIITVQYLLYKIMTSAALKKSFGNILFFLVLNSKPYSMKCTSFILLVICLFLQKALQVQSNATLFLLISSHLTDCIAATTCSLINRDHLIWK